MVKRIFDILISIMCLLLTGWILAIAYLITLLTLKENPIYTQIRIGRDQKIFKIFKIKTMHSRENDDNFVTSRDDPRITYFGKLIRKFKIDELPQIFNVLNGAMSIVGPRPTVIEDAHKMNIEQQKRFSVKPGLTGLAQINGNTDLSWPKRIIYDLEYIDNYSLLLDIKIALKTFLLIILNKVESHPKSGDEWQDLKRL